MSMTNTWTNEVIKHRKRKHLASIPGFGGSWIRWIHGGNTVWTLKTYHSLLQIMNRNKDMDVILILTSLFCGTSLSRRPLQSKYLLATFSTGTRLPESQTSFRQWCYWIGAPLDWIWMDWIWLEWIELLIGLDPTLVELLARQWLYQIWKSTGLRQSSLTSDWSNLLHHLLARIPFLGTIYHIQLRAISSLLQ